MIAYMNAKWLIKTLSLLVCVMSASGCNLSSATDTTLPTLHPTIPYVQIAQVEATHQPEATREIRSIPTLTPTNEATQTPSPMYNCATEVAPDRADAQHTIVANVDYAARRANVSQSVNYLNRSGEPLATVVLNIEANAFDGLFEMDTLTVGTRPVEYAIQSNRLTVMLPEPLPKNCEVRLNLKFLVEPPRIVSGITAAKGYFGHSERQMNLSLWLPAVAPYRDGQWLVNRPQPVGEQTVLEVADWDVTINVSNANGDLRIAAPGRVQQTGNTQWRFQLAGARDFSLSMSENYRILRGLSKSGVEIEFYVFPDVIRQGEGGLLNGGDHALAEAVRAFDQFESLFGDYPFSRFVLVQGDFPDGMEFSGLAYVSTAWFYGFDGKVTNYLTVITIHEVAHQWWYTRVGNDAALLPWLDEALATYSEYIYYEEFYPELKNWWWDFRVGWYNPQGAVDSTVYEFSNAREYINAVYLRGVQMLHNLREDIGTDEFFNLLAAYSESASGRIATSEMFWELLTPEQWELSRDTRTQFFREPPEPNAEASDTRE
jgi:hypothetical protein